MTETRTDTQRELSSISHQLTVCRTTAVRYIIQMLNWEPAVLLSPYVFCLHSLYTPTAFNWPIRCFTNTAQAPPFYPQFQAPAHTLASWLFIFFAEIWDQT